MRRGGSLILQTKHEDSQCMHCGLRRQIAVAERDTVPTIIYTAITILSRDAQLFSTRYWEHRTAIKLNSALRYMNADGRAIYESPQGVHVALRCGFACCSHQ